MRKVSALEKAIHIIFYGGIVALLICLILAAIMAFIPDKYTYKYEGDIISHTGSIYIDNPEEHRAEKVYDVITYKSMDGAVKNDTIKKANSLISTQIRENNFKYMYSYRLALSPLLYLLIALFLVFPISIAENWFDNHVEYTFEELDLFRPLKKFFGK